MAAQSLCGSCQLSQHVAAKSACGSWQLSQRVSAQSACVSCQLSQRVSAVSSVTVWQLSHRVAAQSPCGSSVTVWQLSHRVAAQSPCGRPPQASCGSLEIALDPRRMLLLPCRIWDKSNRVEGLLVLEAHSCVFALICYGSSVFGFIFPNS